MAIPQLRASPYFQMSDPMADVLEFDNARTPLHLVLLRGVGLPEPAQWRLEGRLNQRYSEQRLYAVPRLVASRRARDLCVVNLFPGPTPHDASDEQVKKSLLDAAIVYRSLERRGRAFAAAVAWLVFDDGGRIESHASTDWLVELADRAQRIARSKGLRAASAEEIGHLLRL